MQSEHSPLQSENSPTRAQFDDWSRVRRSLLWVYHGTLGPQHSQHTLETPFSNAWFIERGTARAVVAGSDSTARAGHWLLLRSGPRYQEFSPDIVLLSIRFIWEWFSGDAVFTLKDHLLLIDPTDTVNLTGSARNLAEIVRTELGDPHVRLPFTNVPLTTQLRVEERFIQWLTEYARQLEKHGVHPVTPQNLHPALQRALRLIETESLTDLRTETEVAGAAGISAGHLNRLCTNQFGCSIRELIERRRLKIAHLLLEQPGIAIKEVAWRVGFASPQNFSTWYRRRTGTPPKATRKNP